MSYMKASPPPRLPDCFRRLPPCGIGAVPLLSLICASGAKTLNRRSAGKAAVGGDGGISIMEAAAAVLRLLGRLKSRKVCPSNVTNLN